MRTREDYRRGVEEVERSRASKARVSNSNSSQRVREGGARKKGGKREGGRADTDSGIHSSSSSFLESTRGGQSFYRSYYWPSCCREAYGQQQFYPHPYYSRQAALSWQHLLLTTLPPAYLRLPPQTSTFPRRGGNPGSKWSNNRYRRTSEYWGRVRQGRSMPNLSSSSNESESEEEDEEREWEEEEIEVRPEVRRSSCTVGKVRAQNMKKSSTTIKVQSETFSRRIPQQQGTVRSVPDKFDKWTSEPIFV